MLTFMSAVQSLQLLGGIATWRNMDSSQTDIPENLLVPPDQHLFAKHMSGNL